MTNIHFSEQEILLILLQHQGGVKPSDLCRVYGISAETLNEWTERYGNVTDSDLRIAEVNDTDCQKMKNFIALLNKAYNKNEQE